MFLLIHICFIPTNKVSRVIPAIGPRIHFLSYTTVQCLIANLFAKALKNFHLPSSFL